MRIERVETFVLKLDTGTPYLGRLSAASNDQAAYAVRAPWRSLYSSRYETLLVAITAADGTVGWGEALAPVAPEVPASIVDLLLAPSLIGADPRTPRPTWSRLRDLMRERGHLGGHQADALAAVDIAGWDLAGRLAGAGIADLLGGAFRRDVSTYVSGLPRETDEERAELAAEWERRGARAVKLHLGHGVESDLGTYDAVHRAAPSLRIAIDAHWAYGFSDALALADGLTRRGAWFLEAPLAPEDLPGHADLAARSGVPLAVGEAMRHRHEFLDWMRARAVGIVQPDVARTGITEAMTIAELAAAHHLPVAPHHSVGLGVAQLAGLQFSAAIDQFTAFEYQPTSAEVGAQILRGGASSLPGGPDGYPLPDGPGLGVDIDVDRVRDLAVPHPGIRTDGARTDDPTGGPSA